jgi:hypothetical protein
VIPVAPWVNITVAAGFFRAAQDRIDGRVLHPDSVVRDWQARAAGFASDVEELDEAYRLVRGAG